MSFASPEHREAFAARLGRDLGKLVIVTEDWKTCVEGADIVVEASRQPLPLLGTAVAGGLGQKLRLA